VQVAHYIGDVTTSQPLDKAATAARIDLEV